MYTSSVGKWKLYAAHLKDMLQRLGPIIKDFEQEHSTNERSSDEL